MSIIIPDLDEHILSFMDLPETVNLMRINNYYYGKIKNKTLIKEWNHCKNQYSSLCVNDIFLETCENGYISYARSLLKRHEIYIHDHGEAAFRYACDKGHIEIAKWLIDLGENHGYGRINIHDRNEITFELACVYGHMKLAEWLIDLGENHGYGKINIHVGNDYIYRCIENKHPIIAEWFINLENHGYGKFKVRPIHEQRQNNIKKIFVLAIVFIFLFFVLDWVNKKKLIKIIYSIYS